jgi:class 3 adenylate cyclase
MGIDSENQTWLSTIVFTDIVEYSKRSLEQQIDIKTHFNQLISDAIADMNTEDRVVLDTGDGIALCMLGDPEPAVIVSMELRNQVLTPQVSAPIPYEIRTGINLGPVKLVTDINGRYNVLGDGINVAQRVMSFAGSSQMLVSRAFYEVAWCLSDEYSNLFQYLGIRKDKHGYEHVLYEVHSGTDADTETVDIVVAPDPEPVVDEVTRQVRSRLANEVAPLSTVVFDTELLRRAEYYLHDFVGPLASLLVRKEASRALSMEDLFVRLARAVPAGQSRSAFMANTSKILNDFAVTEEDREQLPNTQTRLAQEADSVPIKKTKETGWNQEVLDRTKKQLAVHIGPLAGMLVRKASRRAKTVNELYTMLANEIPDPKDRAIFLQSMSGNE